MSRDRLKIFAAVVLVGAFVAYPGLHRRLGLSDLVYFSIVLVIAAVAAFWTPSARSSSGLSRRNTFLCDTCKYDNARDCSRPDRPNATSCPDFKSRSAR